ncbi:MAG: DUF4921 family protein [Candidatus Sungbacteria bacterium]|uniref:DUF4921 family protein n=1 Tax=Candidatus Sungiibacteriota bacterium TaxID=2750080 RepID=A0A9D6QRY4_9BACT|nr:DUF4921 family protein [Candidatus Sungbacteria bacterium]
MLDAGKKLTELRQDVVTGEWVVIATGRARRPNDFVSKEEKPTNNIETCPFEKLESDAKLVISKKGEIVTDFDSPAAADWFIEVIPNKFPAFYPSPICPVILPLGPHKFTDGNGFHEVIVSRDHHKSIAQMTNDEAALVIRSYRERMSTLSFEECVEYVSIIHNHGPHSGASITHPHSQLIAIPVVSPELLRSLAGSERYFRENKKCIHCVIIEFELQERHRIIFENDLFVAFAPFASHTSFEVRIFPKLHASEFQNISDNEITPFAEALRVSLAKLDKGLNDPSHNFFIHTAPAKSASGYSHYHWHLEILPITSTLAGFEFATGIEISTITPESAAEFLRSVKVS